jgi:hypothetical protein
VSQIGLVATPVPHSSIPGNYRIAISVNAQDIQLEQRNNRYTGTLILVIRLESSKEKTLKSSPIPLNVPGDPIQTVMKDGIPLRSSLPGKAGDRLRIVVQDQATDSVGSLWVPLTRWALLVKTEN